jgi:hypothetical protein
MKEGFDKEIDLLLRRRARGTAAKSLADGGGNGAATPASAHLDADELGAFAEGALPAGARLAAVTHLADCDRCRGAVVSLSNALGGTESKPHAVAAAVPASAAGSLPASWRGWMATLFSPRALRYAVPLLAVSLVAVVSFVALRTREAGSSPNVQSARPREEVAQTRPEASSAATTATANNNQSGMFDSKPGDTTGEAAPSGTTTAPKSIGRGPNEGESQPAPVGSVAEDVSAPPPPAAPPATSAGPEAPTEIAKSAPKPVTVETSQPPAKSDGEDSNKEKRARAAEPVDEIAANDAAMQRRRAANDVQMPDGGTRNQKRGADNNTSKTYGENNTSAGATQREAERDDRGAGGSLASRRGRAPARAEQKTEEGETARDGETRTAAGHRFRREGSAWLDVNYKPSMRSTGVRRGTEAFRALVADVPVVGRVAEQIAGEVVVVVGGQAYRIR